MEENIPVPPPPPAPPEEDTFYTLIKKIPPRWILIGSIVVVILLLGLFGIIVLQMSKSSQPPKKEIKKEIVSTISLTPVKNQTSGWPTYTNTSYRISFTHPNLSFEGTICGMKPVSYSDNYRIVDATNISYDTSNSCDSFNYFLSFWVSEKDTSIDEQISDIKDLLGFTDNDVVITDVPLRDKKAKKMVLLKSLPTGSAPKASNYFFPSNNEFFFFYDAPSKNVYTIYAHYERIDYVNTIENIVYSFAIIPAAPTKAAQLPIYKYFPQEAFTTPDLVKRNYAKDDLKGYISKDYYSEIDTISDENLLDFHCSRKMTYSLQDLNYQYSIYNKEGLGKVTKVPIASQITHMLDSDPRIGFADLIYCVTTDKKEYVLSKNGKGLQLSQLDGNTAKVLGKDPEINNPYFGCSSILAITKDNTIYISCGGGDTTTFTSIRKTDGSGEIKKIIECATPEEGEMRCTRN